MSDADNTSSPTPDEPLRNEPAPHAAAASTPWPSSPIHVVLQPARSRGRRLLAAMGWIGFLFTALLLFSQWSVRQAYFDTSEGIRERFHSGAEEGEQKVAIIAVRGIILKGDGFVKRQIDRVREDKQVKAVVLRVDSPGGTVSSADYIYHHLKRLREECDIPLVVSMGSMAASGGYYVSMAVGDQEKAIFAEPTTSTGSIGVIVPHYDLSGFLARFDIQNDSVVSHPRKQILSMTKSMSEADREIVQQQVEDLFKRFKSIVKAGRPRLRQANQEGELKAPETERDLATGELFPAPRAQEFGLVDEIGFMDDAISRAIELAGLEATRVRVVEFEQPFSLLAFTGLARQTAEERHLNTLLDLSVSRPYYLATSCPPLLSTPGNRLPATVSPLNSPPLQRSR
ncbi:MAG: signal peptide peptidase SppA [Planctomycetota bacterium]